MKTIQTTAIALAVAVMLSACGRDKPTAEVPRPVRTAEIRYDATREANRYVGTVQSRHEVDQAFRVGGKVAQRKVDVGQVVREGDVLAVIDDTDYRLAEEVARQQWTVGVAQARQAESDRKRLGSLKADGSVSVADDEHAHSGAESAKATEEAQARQLELARNRLQYTVLRASRSGVVTTVRFEIGQVVAEGQPVVSIANHGEPEIVVDVPEDQLTAFKQAHFKASIASAPDEHFEVALRELSPQAAAQTRTYRARLKPDRARAIAARRDGHARRGPRRLGRAGRRDSRDRDHPDQRSAGGVGRQARRQRPGGHRRPDGRRGARLSQRRRARLRSGRRASRHRRRAEDGARARGRAARVPRRSPHQSTTRSRLPDEILQPHRMGARAPRDRALPDPRHRGGRRRQLPAARAARGPEVLRAVDDRDGDLAGRHARSRSRTRS